MQNAKLKMQNSFKKNKVCEHFSVRRTRAKRTHQNSTNPKIVNDEIIFVPNEGTKAQHTQTYVSISLSEVQCKIYR